MVFHQLSIRPAEAFPAAARRRSGRLALRILIVEDDAEAARHMAESLTGFGLDPQIAHDGAAAEAAVLGAAFDVLVLDRMLPGCDGLSLLGRLRAQGVETPALFLTAMGSVADRVAGLEAGGDDYVVKPVDSIELHARIQALARRGARAVTAMVLTHGDLELDRLERIARYGDATVSLLPLEYRLLEVLMLARGQPVTRKMLLEQVWGFRFDPRTNIVETHICRLRARFEAVGATSLIHTVRGAGYALAAA
jgi:two-component system OmpR family response regulator